MARKAVQINQYDLTGQFIRSFDSVEEAVKSVKSSKSNISRVCQYGTPQAHGYIWRYTKCPHKTGTEHSPKYDKEKTMRLIAEVTSFKFSDLSNIGRQC